MTLTATPESEFDLGDLVATGIRTVMTELVSRRAEACRDGEFETVSILDALIKGEVDRTEAMMDEAVGLEMAKDFAAALPLYRYVADSIGNENGAFACSRVGQAFFVGADCEKDHIAAIPYLRGAIAGKGYGTAHWLLGRIYLYGVDGQLAPDYELACLHLQQATDKGNLNAEADLGFALILRDGPKCDEAAVVARAKNALKSKHNKAAGMLLLSRASELGLGGVKQSFGRARRWLRRAERKAQWWDASDVIDDVNRRQKKADRFKPPVVMLALCAAALLVLILASPSLNVMQLLEGALAVANIGAIAAFGFTRSAGLASELKNILLFRKALAEQPRTVRIGGVRWLLVDGEFRHLEFDGGESGRLYKPETSWSDRHRAELSRLNETDIGFFQWAAGITNAALFVAATIWTDLIPVIAVLQGGLFVVSLAVFAEDLAWRCGEQWVKGAKVLDPAPVSLRREEVEQQKAHGDARVSTFGEAVNGTKPNGLDGKEFG